jgi:hypothetical protein
MFEFLGICKEHGEVKDSEMNGSSFYQNWEIDVRN